MTDVFSKSKRSEVMSRIRGRGNRDTEMAFLKLLKAAGITGWRRHLALSLDPGSGSRKRLLGRTHRVKPDFVFRAHRLVVFIDGCFWHGCPHHATTPKANAEFWAAKLADNKERDRYVNRALRRRGWRVVRIWEHDLKVGRNLIERLDIREVTEESGGACPRLRGSRGGRVDDSVPSKSGP